MTVLKYIADCKTGFVPAVSHKPRLTVLPSTTTFALKLSKTVGT